MFKAFVSYSHTDDHLRMELDKHMALLRRQGHLVIWNDRCIIAGSTFDQQITEELSTADIVLVLVSPDFINSDYCWTTELEFALKRHEAGTTRVIPVILRPCDWKSSPIGKLQALPIDARPVVTWPIIDEAFASIAEGIRATLVEMAKSKVENQAPEVRIDDDGYRTLAHESLDSFPSCADSLEDGAAWNEMNKKAKYVTLIKNGLNAISADERIEFLSEAIKLDQCYALAYHLRAKELSAIGRLSDALLDINLAIQIDASDWEALFTRCYLRQEACDIPGALHDANQLIALNPSEVRGYLARAEVHSKSNNLTAAESDAKFGLALDLSYSPAHLVLGCILIDKGDLREATACFDKVLELDSKYQKAYILRARVRRQIGDLKGGLSDINIAISLTESKEPWSYFERSLLNHDLGEFDKAIADISLAIQYGPTVAVFRKQRGVLHQEKMQLNLSVIDFSDWIRLEKQNLDAAFFARAQIRYSLDDYSGMIQDLSDAISLNPEKADYYELRAYGKVAINQKDDALGDLDLAIRFNAKSVNSYRLRAVLLENRHYYLDAIEDFNVVKRLSDETEIKVFAEEHVRFLEKVLYNEKIFGANPRRRKI